LKDCKGKEQKKWIRRVAKFNQATTNTIMEVNEKVEDGG
jgi:hypothetical protein